MDRLRYICVAVLAVAYGMFLIVSIFAFLVALFGCE